jgi:hypothetical protein
MPLWGQFVNRYGGLRENTSRRFRERLAQQSSLQSLEQCFPFQVLSLEAPVSEFYDFYCV